MILRDVFDNGLCLLTESMPDVRSVSLGAWLMRGSRHEGDAHAGIAHFTEHMLFKGTTSRTAEDIAQQVDSMGGQLDAFTAKEYASYYVKVLDEHLSRAVDLLSDLLLRPAFHGDDLDREKKVILEEIKMVEDMPDDLVHELFTESFWPEHPLGRPILGSPASVNAISVDSLRSFFERAYVAENIVIAAAGHLDHNEVRELVGRAFNTVPAKAEPIAEVPPRAQSGLQIRSKEIEQSHLCLGAPGYSQTHEDRYAAYVLNTILGSSMSSRLFQNIREKRGLAYAVSSSLVSYRDVGTVTVYAGCDAAVVPEVVDLVVAELRTLKGEAIPEAELQRAKDHLKGNLVLSLESTTSRMSQLARSEIYFGRQIDLAENLERLDQVTADDVQRVAADLFSNGDLAATVLGPDGAVAPSAGQLDLGG
jgi:predicted Zn-dependent peptidase